MKLELLEAEQAMADLHRGGRTASDLAEYCQGFSPEEVMYQYSEEATEPYNNGLAGFTQHCSLFILANVNHDCIVTEVTIEDPGGRSKRKGGGPTGDAGKKIVIMMQRKQWQEYTIRARRRTDVVADESLREEVDGQDYNFYWEASPNDLNYAISFEIENRTIIEARFSISTPGGGGSDGTGIIPEVGLLDAYIGKPDKFVKDVIAKSPIFIDPQHQISFMREFMDKDFMRAFRDDWRKAFPRRVNSHVVADESVIVEADHKGSIRVPAVITFEFHFDEKGHLDFISKLGTGNVILNTSGDSFDGEEGAWTPVQSLMARWPKEFSIEQDDVNAFHESFLKQFREKVKLVPWVDQMATPKPTTYYRWVRNNDRNVSHVVTDESLASKLNAAVADTTTTLAG